jgi:hypothetical protein
MKTIIALVALTFFNCTTYAQFKVNINRPSGEKLTFDCSSQNDCDEKLLMRINRFSKNYAGVWNDDAIGSIVSRQEIDLDENEVTKYFHPSNFSIEQKDISAELAEQALEQAIEQKIAKD